MNTVLFTHLPQSFRTRKFDTIGHFFSYALEAGHITEMGELSESEMIQSRRAAYERSLVSDPSTRTNL